ncbi:MAG: carbohydrate binding domain-containing protein [Planctomycetota bacterium]
MATLVIEQLAPNPEAWQINLSRKPIALKAGQHYVLRFHARADQIRGVQATASLATPPWTNLGMNQELRLGPEWRVCTARLVASKDENNAQLQLNFGGSAVPVTISNLTFEPAPNLATDFSPPQWDLRLAKGADADFLLPVDQPNLLRVAPVSTNMQKESWHVAIVRRGMVFKEKQRYRFSFRARAEQKRPVAVSAGTASPPWKNLGLNRPFSVGTEWSSYSATFTSPEATTDGQLQIALGESDSPIKLSDFKFEEISPDEGKTFDSAEWQLAVNPPCVAELRNDSAAKDKLHVEIDKIDELQMPWHIRLTRGGIAVRANTKYTVRFKARAQAPRGIVVTVSQGHPPSKNLGFHRLITLSNQWEDYQFRFEPEFDEKDAQIEFNLGNSDIDLELDDVKVDGTEPTNVTVDRRYAYLVNIGGIAVWLLAVAAFLLWRARRPKTAISGSSNP